MYKVKRAYNYLLDFLVAIVNDKVSFEEKIERQIICELCPKMKKDKLLFWRVNRCGVCQCPINQKTKYKYSSCPDKKW